MICMIPEPGDESLWQPFRSSILNASPAFCIYSRGCSQTHRSVGAILADRWKDAVHLFLTDEGLKAMDRLTREQRSRNMSRIRSRNTSPELIVRSLLHRMKFRFRLHRKDLPGSPDIVMPRHRIIIFVHGCFWHQHENCKYATVPKTNTEYWLKKFSRNKARDKANRLALEKMGWRVVQIWECETRKSDELASLLKQRLSADS